jgi:hypothetical protein
MYLSGKTSVVERKFALERISIISLEKPTSKETGINSGVSPPTVSGSLTTGSKPSLSEQAKRKLKPIIVKA